MGYQRYSIFRDSVCGRSPGLWFNEGRSAFQSQISTNGSGPGRTAVKPPHQPDAEPELRSTWGNVSSPEIKLITPE